MELILFYVFRFMVGFPLTSGFPLLLHQNAIPSFFSFARLSQYSLRLASRNILCALSGF